jgi:hypothetical protein
MSYGVDIRTFFNVIKPKSVQLAELKAQRISTVAAVEENFEALLVDSEAAAPSQALRLPRRGANLAVGPSDDESDDELVFQSPPPLELTRAEAYSGDDAAETERRETADGVATVRRPTLDEHLQFDSQAEVLEEEFDRELEDADAGMFTPSLSKNSSTPAVGRVACVRLSSHRPSAFRYPFVVCSL